ncbi:MAG: Ig-like domain repeat protein, partial [Desulfovibrionaceae bacterium]|nr:Ig-like domain repeat protein [Desulfovibrionaceae bacterium]
MVDIILEKPTQEAPQKIHAQTEGNYIFHFDTSEAALERVNDDLVFTFNDGRVLEIINFYAVHTKESMPTFEIDGFAVTGEDFFAALGNDNLMPAAGAPRIITSGRYHIYGTSVLMDGLDHLNGLDRSYDFSAKDEQDKKNEGDIPPLEANKQVSANDQENVNVKSSDAKVGHHAEEVNFNIPLGSRISSQTIVGSYGTLNISDNGIVTYEQTATYDHSNPGADIAYGVETFTIPITLPDGRKAAVKVTVDISDSVPSISVDQTADGNYGQEVRGSIDFDFGGDGEGAIYVRIDGGALVAGQKDSAGNYLFKTSAGTLTLDAKTGDFVYTGLPKSGTDREISFEFTVEDSDGDQAKASTSVHIDKSIVTAYGTVSGNNASSDNDVAAGITHTVVLNDLPADATVKPGTYITEHGKITVEGHGKVTYTQTETYDHKGQGADTATGVDKTDLDVVLGDGSVVKIPVSVDIVDSVPTLSIDCEATGSYGNNISGSVDIDFGADGEGYVSVQINGGEIVYGVKDAKGNYTFEVDGHTVKLNGKNGDFTYDGLPKSGADTSYKFTFYVTDKDGDRTSASTTATIQGTQIISKGTVTGNNAANDSDVAEGVSHSVEISDLPAGATVKPGEYETEHGKITVDDHGEVTYTQTETYDHPGSGEDKVTGADQTEITIILDDGSEVKIPVSVDIVDSIPEITVDRAATGEYGEKVTGSVDINFGADGEGSITVSINGSSPVTGEKGTDGNYTFTMPDGHVVTLDKDTGDFTYNGVPKSGSGTEYKFTFTLTDKDGDTASASTTATITATNITTKGDVAGENASNDSDVDNDISHTVTITDLPEGATVKPGEYETEHGKITVDDHGQVTYTQTETYDHPSFGEDKVTGADQTDITIILDDGSEVKIPVSVDIVDSVPEIRVDRDASGAYGDKVTGSVDIDFGADGEGSITVSINGSSPVTGA